MLKTLLPEKFNWPAYLLIGVFLKLFFYDLSLLSFVVIMLSIYQFFLLFDSIGHIIPTRHLLGMFMCVQFFIGPMFAYNGLDEYQYFLYKMKIPEGEYFSYSIPAVLFFVIGLHINAKNNRGEVINETQILDFVSRNKMVPYVMIIVGLTASIFSRFFSSELAFVFYLLGGFKFIGLFLLVLGEKKLKIVPLLIVITSIISSSLGTGMFHDLLTWFVYIAAVFAIRYKFDYWVKLIGLMSFLAIAIIIQVLKGNYRAETATDKDQAGVETLAKVYQKENEDKGVFSFSNLAESNVRINQGFIITNIMATVPVREAYANGSELYLLIEAAIMPRIFAPDKLNAGDRTIFTKYTGIPLQEGTSMGLSTLGDAYINFGLFGGALFMFALGFLYSAVLNLFHKNGESFPVLILFSALVFYYPIRPDCETQTILGHLVKSCILVFVVIQFWRSSFIAKPVQS